jgi:hypothetical protein
MEIDLKALGISKQEIEDRVVNAVSEAILSDVGYDGEGEETFGDSAFHKKTKELIQKRIDAAVFALAERHVLPNVTSHIENLVIQQTNTWGEKVGNPVTFIEYLTQRADAYMREEVNFEGKTKGQDSYQWRPAGTRIATMIDKHLQYSIESAMKKALENANSSIIGGINNAVKIKLAEVAKQFMVKVETK